MKCPVCSNTLTEIQAGTVLVDVCKGGCGGVWFDDRELKRFDEPHEIDAEAILSVDRAANITAKEKQVRFCPKCNDEAMCRRWYDIHNQVEVDQCLRCSGIWLDPGELSAIRSQYKTEEERQKAADDFLAGPLAQTKESLALDAQKRLADWNEDMSFSNTLKSLFRGLF